MNKKQEKQLIKAMQKIKKIWIIDEKEKDVLRATIIHPVAFYEGKTRQIGFMIRRKK